MIDIKETKRKIRELNKIKKDSRKNSKLRRNLNKKIRELKKRLEDSIIITPRKKELIKEIYKLKPYLKKLTKFNLKKFTIEQLEKHIRLVKEKRKRG